MKQRTSAAARFCAAMLLFGSIGCFVRGIPLPSAQLALCRALIGAAMLAAACLARGGFAPAAVRKDALWLALSGAALGLNWIFLFEAYRRTTLAAATACYYCAPVLVLLLAPLVWHEKLPLSGALCALGAAAGAVLVSGVFSAHGAGAAGPGAANSGAAGALWGLCAAVFYAAVMLLSRFIRHTPALPRTLAQLVCAAAVLAPYAALTHPQPLSALRLPALLLLLTVGLVHTGAAYLLYFSALPQLPARTVSALSYIDPAFAILLGAVFLREPMTLPQALGAALIFGCAGAGEVLRRRAAGPAV